MVAAQLNQPTHRPERLSTSPAPRSGLTQLSYGVLVTLVLATLAWRLGSLVPLVGGPVCGLALGMAAGCLGLSRGAARTGIVCCSKQLLQVAVVLLGAGLGLGQILQAGRESGSIILATISVCLVAAWLLGRLYRIQGNLAALIGVGTAICGGSAIAAISPVLRAEEQEVAYAISTIFAWNVVAVLVFPAAGGLLDLNQQDFGLWAGTAINDTSSVVAAAYTYGDAAGAYATVVKLARTTMLIPVTLAAALCRALSHRRELLARQRPDAAGVTAPSLSLRRMVPWFIVCFLATASLHTLGFLPPPLPAYATAAAKFMIVMAMTAIGLSADLGAMRRLGVRPLLLGLTLWVIVACTSLILQRLS